MLKRTKQEMVSLIKDLGYNITDNGVYVENFPWLMLRTSNYQRLDSLDVKVENITFTIDIFSKYTGEQEIIDITQDITNNLYKIKEKVPAVMYSYQKSCRILDDKDTGPVRKHGVINYQFLLSSGLEEE